MRDVGNGNQPGWLEGFCRAGQKRGRSVSDHAFLEAGARGTGRVGDRLTQSEFSDGDDVEDARWLRAYVGKVGFLQLGWAYQGSMFLCEVSTDWYERYQRLLEMSEDFGGIPIHESDQDDET